MFRGCVRFLDGGAEVAIRYVADARRTNLIITKTVYAPFFKLKLSFFFPALPPPLSPPPDTVAATFIPHFTLRSRCSRRDHSAGSFSSPRSGSEQPSVVAVHMSLRVSEEAPERHSLKPRINGINVHRLFIIRFFARVEIITLELHALLEFRLHRVSKWYKHVQTRWMEPKKKMAQNILHT